MTQRRRRARPRLAPKYRARRAMLTLLVVAVVGVAAWQIFGAKEPAEETVLPEPATPSEPEPIPEPDPEPEPEPEPDPVEEPQVEPVRVAEDWSLLLVNYANPLPQDFQVELEPVSESYRVDTRIAEPLLRMIMQAREDGIDLLICSAHRTVEKQEALFTERYQAFLSQGYTEQEADALTVAETARPGASEHHTGLAVDIVTESYQSLDAGFDQTPAFQWLDKNAHKFGFILRYPKNKTDITQISYEPWHYRYVGEEHAQSIKQAGMCLEEYLISTYLSSLPPEMRATYIQPQSEPDVPEQDEPETDTLPESAG